MCDRSELITSEPGGVTARLCYSDSGAVTAWYTHYLHHPCLKILLVWISVDVEGQRVVSWREEEEEEIVGSDKRNL